MVQAANVEVVRQKAHEHQVKKFELLLSACFAEHNMAVQTVDHITEVLKKGIPDSKIVQDFHLKRTKCTQLIKEVLGKYESQTLVSDLQKVHFSILLDESTDITLNFYAYLLDIFRPDLDKF